RQATLAREAAFAREAAPAREAASARQAAFARFAETGLPHHKIEAWKYTSLVHLARTRFQPAAANYELTGALPARLDGAERAVFVNGRHVAMLSDPPTAGFESAHRAGLVLALGAAADDDPMLSLAVALGQDGAVLDLQDGAAIELLYITAPGSGPQMAHSQNRIRVAAGASATVIERHIALGAGEATLANGATAIELGEGATLTHVKLQAEAANATHVWHHLATIPAHARYDNFVVSVGGGLARNRVTTHLVGAGGHCTLDGAYAGRDRQHLDHTSKIVHAVADTTSRQVYKGVLDDRARGVFQGHIVVAEDAQRTDGHQLNRALMLSDTAEIDSKPMLEIYADDVKCSHGATAGDLDETQLFYLQSRGIPQDQARRLLVEAFLAETIDAIPFAPARAAALALVQEHLAR
ncbi:MAG: Fe-S cluster assembly protein SufD, partial [Alphaproteobacteria bacterium]|nr:Fe-S cluster assembly protein SufD [Alphaproteobacteria bacterium]